MRWAFAFDGVNPSKVFSGKKEGRAAPFPEEKSFPLKPPFNSLGRELGQSLRLLLTLPLACANWFVTSNRAVTTHVAFQPDPAPDHRCR